MIEEIANKAELKIDKTTWKLTKLGELAEDISSRVDNPAQSEYDRFVGLEHFVSGDLKIKSWGTTENLTSSAKAFKKGDILFARRNAYLRRASMVEFDGCCSGDAFVLRENHEKIVPGFLAFIVNSNGLWDYANSNAAGTMSQRVKWRDLANYEFLLPSKEEQAKLAELLWAMDEVMESRRALLQKFLLFKRLHLNELFLGHEITRGFKNQCQLEEHCIRITYGFTNPMPTTEEGVLMVTATNIRNGKIDIENTRSTSIEAYETLISEKSRPLEGDILITKDGRLAEIAIVGKEKICINQSVAVIRPKGTLLPKYLYYLLQISFYQNLMIEQAGGTAIKHIYITKLAKMKIPTPPLDQQMELVNIASSISQNQDLIEKTILSSERLQKSLINQIF